MTKRSNKGIIHSYQLTDAKLGEAPYAYSYDNIGNRITAQEDAEHVTYEANNLNQYTQIDTDGTAFVPEYDEDGNQTRVRTSTGIWKVQYNAQNRAIRYEPEADSTHVITCVYDSQGRRVEKKEEKEGAAISHVRYVYRGYLQVAAYDLLAEGLPSLWQIIWDPTQSVATRPLAIRKDGSFLTYGWDLTKNICETYTSDKGFLSERYTYSPFGKVTVEGDTVQPLQWSSEVYDAELGLVYYNYRYYNPLDGRWTRREPWGTRKGGIMNLYLYVSNGSLVSSDKLGLFDLLSQNQSVPPNPSSSQQQNNTSLPADQYDVETSDNTKCGQIRDKALQDAEVKDFMAKIGKKCNLPQIVCACCKGSKEGAGAWNVPKSEKDHIEEPYIVLCTNGSQSNSSTPGTLIHELTHFLQVCEGRPGKTCDDYYVNEVEANRNQGKSLEEALEAAQWSVSHTGKCAPYTPSNDALNKAREVYYRNN